MRLENAKSGIGAVNAENSTGQPTQIITPMLVQPTHGQSISSSNISQP
jgi:hypothetical protein